MPGQVEDLNLTASSHNISVTWEKPFVNSYCVTQYVIHWVHTLSENENDITVPIEAVSYVIDDLDACVKYEVSVTAVNEENERGDAVTCNTTTETVGNYHVQVFDHMYDGGMQK